MFCAAAACWRELRGDVLHEARDLVRDLLDLLERRAGVLGEQRAAHHVGGAALHRDHGFVGVGLNGAHQHFDLACVALAARSARRCTSSATTAKPRPASPAIEAWIEAFSARMLVCSAMSLISSTMLPISCELSPRRLMRLRGLLDGLADRVHAVDRAAHGIAALVRDVDRVARDVRGALGVARDFLGRRGHARRPTRWRRRSASTARRSPSRGAPTAPASGARRCRAEWPTG